MCSLSLVLCAKTFYSPEHKDTLEKREVWRVQNFHACKSFSSFPFKGKVILHQNHQNNFLSHQ